MTSFGFGLSEIISIPSVFKENSTNTTSFTEHRGRFNNVYNAFLNSILVSALNDPCIHLFNKIYV